MRVTVYEGHSICTPQCVSVKISGNSSACWSIRCVSVRRSGNNSACWSIRCDGTASKRRDQEEEIYTQSIIIIN